MNGVHLASAAEGFGVHQTIEPNERIAQLVITPYIHDDFEEVWELDETARGGGGFGSTGRE